MRPQQTAADGHTSAATDPPLRSHARPMSPPAAVAENMRALLEQHRDELQHP